jgi:hypothetical protein
MHEDDGVEGVETFVLLKVAEHKKVIVVCEHVKAALAMFERLKVLLPKSTCFYFNPETTCTWEKG